MTSQGEQLDIQPLWIAVHQEQPGGPARFASFASCSADACSWLKMMDWDGLNLLHPALHIMLRRI